jgi:uncharacterized protein (DUF983 family)
MDVVDSPQAAVRAAFQGRCPRCGRGLLFCGYLSIAPGCAACGLDYSTFDPGDGPAVFVILIVGFLVAGGALIVEVAFRPPYWVHAAIWLPAIFILAFGFLRLVKSTLMVLQYKHRAGEAHLID